MKTIENNVKKLFNAGLINYSLPKMGGIVVVNGIRFDKRDYYSGRGDKYNKNINHEEVVIKITQKEIAKAMRHLKMNMKIRSIANEYAKRAYSKSRPSSYQNCNTCLKYAFTKSRGLYLPNQKEISRVKI